MINKIMVIGAGTMGSGIAQLAGESGFEVILVDTNESMVEEGMKSIKKRLTKKVEKGKLEKLEVNKILDKIRIGTNIKEGKDSQIVIEAAIEDINIKKDIFKELDRICNPNTVLGTNTSSLSITEIAMATKRPDKVIGIHFFNPVHIMKLIEIIKGIATSKKTVEIALNISKALGKEPIQINESPGFVVNRLLIPMINEAAFLVLEGVSSVEEIDMAMKLGANHPIGPLALGDMIGLDVCLYIMKILHSELGEDKYRPCSLISKMVKGGKLGKKTGEGFYKYGS